MGVSKYSACQYFDEYVEGSNHVSGNQHFGEGLRDHSLTPTGGSADYDFLTAPYKICMKSPPPPQ